MSEIKNLFDLGGLSILLWDKHNLPKINLSNYGMFAYRYYDAATGYWDYDHDGEPTHYQKTGIEIHLEVYKVLRFTPKGFIIERFGEKDKFINHSWRKKFAHLSLQQAMESFVARKKSQVRKLSAQLETANAAYRQGLIELTEMSMAM